MVMPIQLIFRFFQSKARILVWLYEQTQMKIEGNIIGFDEYMNVVLEDACEIDTKTNGNNDVDKLVDSLQMLPRGARISEASLPTNTNTNANTIQIQIQMVTMRLTSCLIACKCHLGMQQFHFHHSTI